MMECRRNGKPLRGKIDTPTDDFKKVLEMIKTFITEPFAAVVNLTEYNKKWSAVTRKWDL